MYVGDTFFGPSYLAGRIIGNALSQPMAPYCQAGQQYFTDLQTSFAALGTNAQWTLMYGNGLFISCTNSKDVLYHISLDDTTFNQVSWYSLNNCNFYARWIIDITGTGTVQFQGAPLSGILERLVYNVLGAGRDINVINSLNGNLLAPNNNLKLPNGVTVGNVVVGNVTTAIQNNRPFCQLWANVKISLQVLVPVKLGDTVVYVANLTNLIIGDTICNNGNCQQITAFYASQNGGKRATNSYGFGLSGPIGEVPEGGILTAIVNPNTAGRGDGQVLQPFPAPVAAASNIVSSVAALALLMALF